MILNKIGVRPTVNRSPEILGFCDYLLPSSSQVQFSVLDGSYLFLRNWKIRKASYTLIARRLIQCQPPKTHTHTALFIGRRGVLITEKKRKRKKFSKIVRKPFVVSLNFSFDYPYLRNKLLFEGDHWTFGSFKILFIFFFTSKNCCNKTLVTRVVHKIANGLIKHKCSYTLPEDIYLLPKPSLWDNDTPVTFLKTF